MTSPTHGSPLLDEVERRVEEDERKYGRDCFIPLKASVLRAILGLARLFAASPPVGGATREPHPEDTCERCGRANIVWFAPNEVWNRAMPDDGGILCPVCFVQADERAGNAPGVWCLVPAPPTGEPAKPVYDSAEWWKAVAQGLSRKFWPTSASAITPTRCSLCTGTFHPNHSPESVERQIHDNCAADYRATVETPHTSDTKLLGAWTPEFYAGDYPPYVNLTMERRPSTVVLTVRAPTVYGAPPGATSHVRLTHQAWLALVALIPDASTIYGACDELDAIL